MFGLMGSGSGAAMATHTGRDTGLLRAEGITNILAATGSKKDRAGIGYPDIGINYRLLTS
jgi:hypothetical protein